jgi:NDP-sugar pyrophosphorylase family protein
MKTVILAGGRGTRLAPYTSVLPKPLLPVGDRAILEILVEQLRRAGFTDITLSVGHLAHLIRAVFDNGPGRGDLDYVHEEHPLGTAAPLLLVNGLDETFLVMNGDVLTTLDLNELVRFHRERGHEMTIASLERRTRFDYGVIEVDEAGRVRAFSEKPEVTSLVSMGIYVMEPNVLNSIPHGEPFDFPDLVHALVDAGRSVGVFPFSGYWRDLGRQEDYAAANEEWGDVFGAGDTAEK